MVQKWYYSIGFDWRRSKVTDVIEGQERNEWTDELENTPKDEQICGKK